MRKLADKCCFYKGKIDELEENITVLEASL